jgi:excisionase family DNA binding protein
MRVNRSGACTPERFYFGERTMDENRQPTRTSDAFTASDVQEPLPGIARDAAYLRSARPNPVVRNARSIRYDDLPEVLTPKEVRAFLRLGRNAIYAALQGGKIRSVRVGQKFLIPKAALREFLDRDAEHLPAGIPVKGTP